MMIDNPSNLLMILSALERLVGQVLASNTIAFIDDELLGTGHNKAGLTCAMVARVLIDNASAINA